MPQSDRPLAYIGMSGLNTLNVSQAPDKPAEFWTTDDTGTKHALLTRLGSTPGARIVDVLPSPDGNGLLIFGKAEGHPPATALLWVEAFVRTASGFKSIQCQDCASISNAGLEPALQKAGLPFSRDFDGGINEWPQYIAADQNLKSIMMLSGDHAVIESLDSAKPGAVVGTSVPLLIANDLAIAKESPHVLRIYNSTR